MSANAQVRGYVQAGGASTRFGQDKALAEIGGKPMVVRTCELLCGVTQDVAVVGAPQKYAEFGVPCVADRWPGEGPLGGIVTALLETAASDSRCEWNLMVSCDMPFLTREWLTYLIGRSLMSKARVVLPCSAQGPEPLSACYRTDAGSALQQAFEGGVHKITDALQKIETEVLDEADWKRFDTASRLFWNMNTLADYEEARRILEAQQR